MSENSPLESASPLEDAWFASRMPSRDPPTEKKLHRPVRLRFLPPSCHVGSGDVSNDERGMERPARTKSRSQICRLGGRSFSSDITMPLCLTAACARSDERGSNLCRARLVRPGRIRGAGFQPRHKRTRLDLSTACAGSLAQSPPYGVDVRAHQMSSLLGGRSLSSDITMPLSLTTARADLPAQSPPYGVVVRGSIPCRARFVRPGRIRGARFNLSRTEPRGPRRKRIGLRPTTACACLAARSSCESASLLEDWRAESPAQLRPYGVDVRAHQVSSLLGGRSLSSDTTMPLCLTTACADSPAQLPPCGVAVRASFRGPLVPGSDHEPGSRCPVCASRSNLRDAVSARYRDTNHSTLATAFPWPPAVRRPALGVRHPFGGLIYGTGIRNRAKPLKTLDRDPF
jgi:hypothetical protein